MVLVPLLATAMLGVACAGPAGQEATTRAADAAPVPPASRNWLVNPGFERGREGWTAMGTRAWGAFDVVGAPVRSGQRAAHLAVDWPAEGPSRPVKVYGVVQEPAAHPFPSAISGWYRVESWERGHPATDLYLQVVVIVWGDPRAPALAGVEDVAPDLTNYQIRYYLAGLDEPPFRLRNARYRFVTRGDPPLNQWIRFDIDVKRDFEELWGVVPEGYEYVRVLFEARWDNKPDGSAVHADVYYDDLYLGPREAADAP